jgi:hypothetical protein
MAAALRGASVLRAAPVQVNAALLSSNFRPCSMPDVVTRDLHGLSG